MIEEKFLMLKRHPASEGLSDEVVQQIADECELIRFDSGETIHRANDMFESVFLLIYGRVKQSIIDFKGNVILERYQTAGGQIGALAAALGEPSPLTIAAEEPTALLKVEYKKLLKLTKQHDLLRENFSRLIAGAVRNLVLKDRRQKQPGLVAIFHQSSATRPITRQLITRLLELGERPCILNDQTDWQPMEGVDYCCFHTDSGTMTKSEFREQMNRWSDSKRIFFDADAAIDLDSAMNLVEFSDKVFWCVTSENWRDSVSQIEAIEKRAPGWHDKFNIIWLLEKNSGWAPFAPELYRLAKRNFKLAFGEPPKTRSRELVNGLERIVHQLRGIRIGVALGGGAALGMAHLGVLKTLEQNGIVVDMIAGTSAGAMTGILYASGMEPDYNVASFVKDLRPGWFFRQLPSSGYWYLLYKYRRGQFDPMLRKYLKDSRLQQLVIPVVSVTVDLISGKAVIRNEGDSVHAITESINLPVLSTPINRDGRALIDGGIVNNVPADILVNNGCNFVIAVSVTAKMKEQFASNRPDTPTAKMKSASAIQTILRTYIVQNVNMNSIGVEPADFVIQPDMSEFDITEFTRAEEMAAIGERTTLDAIPELKKLLARLDDKLFEDLS